MTSFIGWRTRFHVLLGLLLVVPVFAQDVTPPKLSAPNPRGRSNLVAMALHALETPEGSADVGLSPEQMERVRELSKSLHVAESAKLKPLDGLPQEELVEKAGPAWNEFARDGEKGLSEILSPEQQRRTRQIVLQLMRASAFRLPEVQEALKLTETQKHEIARLHEQSSSRLRELAGQQGNFEARKAESRDVYGKMDAAVLAVLGESQRATWTQMIGKPYQRPQSIKPRNPAAGP